MVNRTSVPGRPAKACVPVSGDEVRASAIRPPAARGSESEAPDCNSGGQGATPWRALMIDFALEVEAAPRPSRKRETPVRVRARAFQHEPMLL